MSSLSKEEYKLYEKRTNCFYIFDKNYMYKPYITFSIRNRSYGSKYKFKRCKNNFKKWIRNDNFNIEN